MIQQTQAFNPPMSFDEMFELCQVEEPIKNEQEEWYNNLLQIRKLKEESLQTNYLTKKDLKQAIKETNARIEYWMDERRKGNPFAFIHIEEDVDRKEKLQKRLTYISSVNLDKGKDDKERAKLVPIDHFIQFDSRGFHKCLWHEEKTGSMHLLPGKTAVWCFGGCGRHDVIDVVMAHFGLPFNEAVKFILKK